MVLSLILPQSGKKAATKDYIITVLGYDWPLTPKKIHNLLKKKYAHAVTFQAVFKTIQMLCNEGVLEKKKQDKQFTYQLNMKWLKELHRYTEVIETNYYTKNRLKLIEGIKDARIEGNINILTFETLFDVEKYLYYLQKQFIHATNKKSVICTHHNHEWRPLFYLRAEYNWQSSLLSKYHQTYTLCAGDTPVDRWSAKFYRSIGCRIKTNTNCAGTNEMMVFDDYVIQIFLPQELKTAMDKFLDKPVESLNHKQLIRKIFEKKTEIQVVINRDRKIADQIKAETLKHF